MPKYLKFYKPFEVLCKFTDRKGRQTLKDFINVSGVYPAGRLDFRSEGLLFLTNEGWLNQLLTNPRFEHSKIYLAQVEGLIPCEVVRKLNQSIVLPGIQTKLASAEIVEKPSLPPRSKPVRAYHPTSWLRISIQEGKKHQVRRMTAAVGYPTLRLIRIGIANITLEGLQPGEWQELSARELSDLKRILYG